MRRLSLLLILEDNMIRNFFEQRFERLYSTELARIFVANATFSECLDESPCDVDIDDFAIDVYTELCASVTDKLIDFFPNVRQISRKESLNSKRVILVRIYTTCDAGDIVYGMTAYLRTKKGWNIFDPFNNRWESLRYVPYSKFLVKYENDGHKYECHPEFFDDCYFVY